jgi:uncharacterized protein (DUF2384 family)
MTIDERLERLAERHESMMRFLEQSTREYDRRSAENERLFADNKWRIAEILEDAARVLCTVQQDGENIQALVRVAERSA